METLPSLMKKVFPTLLLARMRYALCGVPSSFLKFLFCCCIMYGNGIFVLHYNIHLELYSRYDDALIYQGMQQDNTSLLYYVPSYGPYSTGFVGVDGKQAYTSSEYIQQPYGSEAFPCYTYDYAGNGSSSNKIGSVKSAGTSGSGRSNGFNVAKTNSNLSSKSSALPYNSKTQQPNSSRSIYQNQSLHPFSKVFCLRIIIYN